MAKKNGKRSDEGQYVALPYAMLKSVAWRSLSGNAVRVCCELHTRYNGGNNGAVRLSMAEALGIGKATAGRAFAELQEKGFLVLAKPGAWYHRRAHEWRLTNKSMQNVKGKTAPTNNWRSWHPRKKNRTRYRNRTVGQSHGYITVPKRRWWFRYSTRQRRFCLPLRHRNRTLILTAS